VRARVFIDGTGNIKSTAQHNTTQQKPTNRRNKTTQALD